MPRFEVPKVEEGLYMADSETNHETNVVNQIEWHGKVGGDNPDPNIWKGHASAREYDFGKLSPEFYKERLPYYYQSVTPGSPVRCVEKRFSGAVGVLYDYAHSIKPSDELLAQVFINPDNKFSSRRFRGTKGIAEIEALAHLVRTGTDVTDHPNFIILREEVEAEPLGPQTVGGTHAMAYSYRIAKGFELGSTLQGDIEFLAQVPDMFKGGNHKDETAVAPRIGCTAVDQDETILYRSASAFVRPVNERISRFLLDYTPDPRLEKSVLLGFDQLNEPDNHDNYFMRTGRERTHRQAGLRTLERAHGSETEIVAGSFEGAVFFLVNRGEGQTFHKNLWGLDIMGTGIATPPGAYNYDLWRSIERSKSLFPNDALAQRRFMKARCLYAASTLTVLCDGSLELGELKVAS